MTRRTATIAAVTGAVLAATVLVVVVLLAARGGDASQKSLLPAGRVLVARGTIWPNVYMFADTVTARVEASVDRRRLDPDRLVLDAKFTPYERVGPIRVERRDLGHESRLIYTIQLRCLEYLCTPKGQRLPIRFRPGRLATTTAPRFSAPVRWPPIELSSWINETELRAFEFRTQLTPLPQPTYRIAPATLAAITLGVAALLVLLAAALLARVARRTFARRLPELDLPPVERALYYLRRAADGEDRRRALELLATALEDERRAELARTARKLAWSLDPPTQGAAAELAASVDAERKRGAAA